MDFIYVLKEIRGNQYAKYLVYGVKEHVIQPLIIDVAVFTDGQTLIQGLSNYAAVSLKVLDKKTGDITKFKELVHDENLCYLVENTGIGHKYVNEAIISDVWFEWFNQPKDNKYR